MDNHGTLEIIEAQQAYTISLIELATACSHVRSEMMVERLLRGFDLFVVWKQRRITKKAWRSARTICYGVNESCAECHLRQIKNPVAFVELLVYEGDREDYLSSYAKACYDDLCNIGTADIISPEDIMLRYDQQKRQKF